jgi:hypothetical protein
VTGLKGDMAAQAAIRRNVAVDPTSGCWNWKLSLTSNGYGKVKFRGRTYRANRLAYEAFNGALPNHLDALHSCDNKPCCNPAHLRAGTHQDNMDEMKARGLVKPARGTAHGLTTLDEGDVRCLRVLVAFGTVNGVASRFGVSARTVRRVRDRESWGHLP